MKKTPLLILLTLFFAILLCSCNMGDLPTGKLLSTHISPENTYTINIYLCGGNATTDYSIRGEIVYNDNNETKNIYWNYHEETATVEWISDEIVIINDIKLDISKKEIFDWRKTGSNSLS